MEIDTRIGKANQVLRESYRSMVSKMGLSNTSKLSVFKSVFVPIFTCGHKSCVMIERSQVQAAVMGFLLRVHDVTLRNKVRICQVHKALNAPWKKWQGRSCWQKAAQCDQGLDCVTTSPTWLGPVMVKIFDIDVDRGVFGVLLRLLSPRPSP